MRLMVLVAAAFAAGLASADGLNVERLEGDLFRVRMARGEKWPESGLNRYGILKDLPVLSTGEALEGLPVRPSVRQVGKGFELRFPMKPDTRVFGLGDVCRTNVNRRGSSFLMWVKNVTSYIPVPVAFTSEGWGVFVNTTWRHTFDVGQTDKDALVVTAPEGEVDFYLFAGEDMRALLKTYTGLTGRPAMLPAWGYGFTYVCNDNVDEFKVLDEAEHFRNKGFPCDVIGLEPEWMKTYYDKSLKKDWDPDRYHFPSWAPNGNSGTWGATEPTIWPQALAGMGFKLSLWLCCDYDLFRYEEQCAAGTARKAGRQPDLAAGIAEFWQDDRITGDKKSGDKRYRPELEVEEGKLPWFEHLKKFVDQGARCFKLDGAWQVTEHPDRAWANGMTDEQAHNLYPLVYAKQMARGYEDYVGKRSMVYSSGGWAGIQQYIASWAGDTGGGVKPLGSILNLGMSGHSNHSCDMQIGDPKSRHFGFLQAWSQQNNWYYWKQAWYMRPEKQASFREYGKLRYRLLPYLYGAAAEASRTGWPVVRSLAIEYPGTAAYDQTITTYKLGDALLVSAFAPETEIPAGEWFDWWTDAHVQGPAKRPETVTEARGGGLYVKAGAIIPTWPEKTHVDKGWNEEVIFEVWPSKDGTAELYEDDGESLDYRSGACARTPLAVTRGADGRITFTVGKRTGSFKGMPETRRMKVRLHVDGCVEEADLGDVGADGAQFVREGRRPSRADGYRLHVWVELLGFDNAASDCGVASYLARIAHKPEAVTILFTTNRLFRNHRGTEDYPIPPWACSYFGREHNPERVRQDWTAGQVRRLVKALKDRGVEVYASFFNLFERMPMSDERLEEELGALVPFLTDLGFSGFHAADGYAPPSHVLDKCADADRPRLARENAVRFAANVKRMADVLHAKGLKVFANSTWTRDPYESLFRYGVDYRLLAKTGLDGVYLESSGAAQRILGCNKGHATLPLDRCRAMAMLAKAAMPEMPLVLLHAINDGQEQWSALRHAPAAAKSEALELGNVYYGDRRAIDGFLACLGDGLAAAEWKTLTDTWALAFTPTKGPVGPRVVWSDRAFDAEFDACAVSRDASTYRLLSELIARGAPLNGVVSVADALKAPSLPLVILNPAYFPKDELTALRKRTAHVTEFGRGAETVNRLPYVMITDEQRKFPGMPDVQYYWRQPLHENLPDPRDFNEIVAIVNDEENAPYRVTSPDVRTWAVRLANGRLGVFARNGADTYAEAQFNVVCNPAHVQVHTDFPAVPVSTTFRARIAPEETVLFSYEEAGLTPPNRPPQCTASGEKETGR